MATSTRSAIANPFPGLRPFHDSEEHLFFGRESQVDKMIDKLAETRFLTVVGTSGSGKSSLVNCGLRPALHRGLMAKAGTSWRIAQFRPGSDPLRAMARSLAQDKVLFRGVAAPGLSLEDMIAASLEMSNLGLADVYQQAHPGEGVNLLVVVDQFEELFRYRTLGNGSTHADSDRSQEARAFVNLLLEARAQADLPIYIVVTMRSDFLGDCAEFTGLPEAMNQGQYLVPRLTREERRAAIAGPVRLSGVDINPALLTQLVNDVGDNPDQLSILQHALNRTWARWQDEGGHGSRLELKHYEAIGTMAHALDQHADESYLELQTERQREICRKIFKALTDRGTDTRGIRRPMHLSTLSTLAAATTAEVAQVIEIFRQPSRSFLMPPQPDVLEPGTVIDISHESLMRVWERLKTWADEEAQSAQLYHRLSETAALHAVGRAGLWRDPDLQVALGWRDRQEPTEAWAALYGGGFEPAMNFLAQSEAQRRLELREREDRQKQELEQAQALSRAREQARSSARFRRLTMGLAVMFVLAIVFGALAWVQRNRADHERQEAQGQAAEAKKAQANADVQRGIADQKKGEAIDAERRAEEARNQAEQLRKRAEGEAQKDTENEHQANSLRFAETAIDSIGERDKDIDPERAVVLALQAALATSSSKSVTPEAEYALRRSVEAFRLQKTLEVPPGTLPIVRFSSDGKRLAAFGTNMNGGARLWDVNTGTVVHQFDAPGRLINVAFSPDARYLATETSDNHSVVHLWELATGKPAGDLVKLGDAVETMAFSGDGKYLAVASRDMKATLWTVPGGSLLKTLPHEAGVQVVAFSPDNKYLATASEDQSVRLWNLTGSDNKVDKLAVPGRAFVLALSEDGLTVAALSHPPPGGPAQPAPLPMVSLWRRSIGLKEASAGGGTPLRVPAGEVVTEIAVSPDGRRVVTLSATGVGRIWDTGTLRQVPWPAGHNINLIAFSPDGRRLATAGTDKRIVVFDVATANEMFAVAGHKGGITSLKFSPDGARLATGSVDGTARIWSTVPGSALAVLTGHDAAIYRIAFSADGTRLATAGWDKTARIWDAASGRELRAVSGHSGEVEGIAFSKDGKLMATSSADGTAKVWDAASGKSLFSLAGSGDQIMAVTFSCDGKRLATAGWDHTARIWDAATGRELLKLTGHTEHVEDVAFSPDGNWLASASSDQTAKVWDAHTGKERLTLRGHNSWVLGVAFSPDGKKLATASADREGGIWDLSSGKEIAKLLGHGGIVRSIAFSPRGSLLATASEDGTVKLWNSNSGSEVYAFPQQAAKLYGIAFSPDGSRLAASASDGGAIVYAVSGNALVELAQSRHPRSLTANECLAYKVESPECRAAVDVQKGLELAKAGDATGAYTRFEEAKKRDPRLAADTKLTQREANRLAAESWAAQGRDQASAGDAAGAVACFQKAEKLDPARVADPKLSAREAYRTAAEFWVEKGSDLAKIQALGAWDALAKAVSAYSKVDPVQPDGVTTHAAAYNNLCWFGSLLGHATDVLGICDSAVKLVERIEPATWNYRDSRALARGLSGNRRGAIEDYDFFIAHTDLVDIKKQRQEWVEILRKGGNPYTPEVLKLLFGQ